MEISAFNYMIIPRYVFVVEAKTIEIHGFCDASAKAYASVVYLRSVTETIHISLIASKTRVAPVQHVSLPRLELCSALLLAELVHAVKLSLKCNIDNTFLWSDSTIALSWIQNPPTKGNQFVQHRVAKIHTFTESKSWHHIPGKLNPADIASRGLYPESLKNHSEWWQGPKWLLEHNSPVTPSEIEHSNQTQSSRLNLEFDTSENKSHCYVTEKHNPNDFFKKYSSFSKLIRVTAWVLRFLNNAKTTSKIKGPLVAQELEQSTKRIIKLIQEAEFSMEIKLQVQNRPLAKKSKLSTLNIFLDNEGILRVGGRLRQHQALRYDQKFPMVVPKNHHVATLIIRYFHLTSLHGGPELVLSLIRQKFWIPDGRSTVKKEIRKCCQCIRFNSKPITQIMGDLPEDRITPVRAFQKVGVDFAGPISTKCQHSRKASTFKSYLCVFICMCTKAVHLEAVTSLSAEAFLATLRRFIARRGVPSDIYSDNGRNFVRTSSYLNAIFQVTRNTSVQNFVAQMTITWHFTPPYAPNFGGLWEAAVKLAKRHLHKTLQGSVLNFEELSTLLCQIEACINSRPLIPLSTDPNDFRALTPGHFLIGVPLCELPEYHVNNSLLSLSHRWKLLQRLKDQFWRRWNASYLTSLQNRPKWKSGVASIKVEDLVLLKEKDLPPLQWPLGRIVDVFPGRDGVTRVVKVKTASGIFTRPLSRILSLPGPRPEDVEEEELQNLPPGGALNEREQSVTFFRN